MKSETRQVLAQARDFVAAGWTRSAYARNKHRAQVSNLADSATCFCIMGAIGRAMRVDNLCLVDEVVFDDVLQVLGFRSVGDAMIWNDNPYRYNHEVVERFDTALA